MISLRCCRWNSTSLWLLVVTLLLVGPATAQNLNIATGSPLPEGTVGRDYTETLVAVGGTSPYAWSLSGALPPGLTLGGDGSIAGIPTAAGTYSFIVRVTDATGAFVARSFALTVTRGPLAITTNPPLFDATVGASYVQTFSADGGTPPYTWSVVSGATGLPAGSLDRNTGVLAGIPEFAGTFRFTIRVNDSAGDAVSRSFSLTVNPPSLTITSPATLPGGAIGVSYRYNFTVIGGTSPYNWTLTSGEVPGLVFDGGTAVLSGVPTTPGTFGFSLEARDSEGVTAARSFTLAITPATLKIDSPEQLPQTTLGAEYSFQMVASGGVKPYSWSTNGLPEGLTINGTSGLISGTVQEAGVLPFTVRVIDADLTAVSNLFQIEVALLTVPPVTISGLPGISGPAKQFPLQISISSPYSSPISGQAIITFSPDVGGGDGSIQFAGGGTTASFEIPVGSTEAISSPALALQTGTVAGTISVSLRLQSGGLDATPSPAPAIVTQIERAAPVIRSARVIRKAGGFDIEVVGFSTAREVTQATYRFSPAPGQSLQVSQVVVPLESLFSSWFQDSANNVYGSQFVLTEPFSIQGDANAVLPQSVTLTNRFGDVTLSLTE